MLKKGWGRIGPCAKKKSDKLKEVQLDIIDDRKCREAKGDYQNFVEGKKGGKGGISQSVCKTS